MGGNAGKSVGSRLDCGCRVEVRGDELHIFPCSSAHQPALTDAARKMAAERRIPYEVRVDRRPR